MESVTEEKIRIPSKDKFSLEREDVEFSNEENPLLFADCDKENVSCGGSLETIIPEDDHDSKILNTTTQMIFENENDDKISRKYCVSLEYRTDDASTPKLSEDHDDEKIILKTNKILPEDKFDDKVGPIYGSSLEYLSTERLIEEEHEDTNTRTAPEEDYDSKIMNKTNQILPEDKFGDKTSPIRGFSLEFQSDYTSTKKLPENEPDVTSTRRVPVEDHDSKIMPKTNKIPSEDNFGDKISPIYGFSLEYQSDDTSTETFRKREFDDAITRTLPEDDHDSKTVITSNQMITEDKYNHKISPGYDLPLEYRSDDTNIETLSEGEHEDSSTETLPEDDPDSNIISISNQMIPEYKNDNKISSIYGSPLEDGSDDVSTQTPEKNFNNDESTQTHSKDRCDNASTQTLHDDEHDDEHTQTIAVGEHEDSTQTLAEGEEDEDIDLPSHPQTIILKKVSLSTVFILKVWNAFRSLSIFLTLAILGLILNIVSTFVYQEMKTSNQMIMNSVMASFIAASLLIGLPFHIKALVDLQHNVVDVSGDRDESGRTVEKYSGSSSSESDEKDDAPSYFA